MWTPKRILIFLVASLGFLALFAVAYIVGSDVDALPLLPPHFLPPKSDDPDNPPFVPPSFTERDLMIAKAFGPECEELKRGSKIWLPAKGAVVAANKFDIEKDGRVKLTPFSIGIFPKNKAERDQRFPEINTVQCEYAILTLDQPITKLGDLSNSKVVAVELGGSTGVKIVNNRRSPEKHDDLELYVTEKPLYYEEARNLIWSTGYVKLLDTQSRPEPMRITAIGMEVLLNKDNGPNRDKKDKAPAKKGGNADAVSGVEKITLLANVDMHLYVDGGSGFMAPDEGAKKPAPKGEPVEKAHVHIKTNGKFAWDLIKDVARFDAPQKAVLAHDRVTVTRHQKAAPPAVGLTTDLLDCDHLDLHFRKKAAAPDAKVADAKGANPTEGSDKEIDLAVATANPDGIVELHVEGEEMHAFGVEMRYYAPTPKSGPRTIIKGAPMHAMRQGHQIRCEELHLTGSDAKGDGQEAFAKGPGKIDLLDKATGKLSSHVLFKKSFTMTKDKDGDRVYDLLTLREDAAYVDEEGKQELHAEQYIHLWLEKVKPATSQSQARPMPAPGAPADPKKKDDFGTSNKPHKLEAFGKVNVRSPELNIHDANHLTVCFRDKKIEPKFDGIPVLPAIGAAPKDAVEVGLKKEPEKAPMPQANPASPQAFGENPSTPDPKTPPQQGGGAQLAKIDPVPGPGAPKEKEKDKEKPKRPLDITAGEITAYVAVAGNVKELIEFVAENNVHVTQAAEDPKEKGLDIVGTMLNLVRKPGGDVLTVFGEARKLAQLQLNDTYLFGPKVTIDQVENTAFVEGTGAMHMPSSTTLDGKKKDGHITIHWNKEMWFNGRSADFKGGVEAFQDNSKVRCQEMQVTLDRPVDFKQKSGSQPAKVDKILCNAKENQQVFILEEERDPKTGRILLYRRILMPVVEVDNTEQRLNGVGPGVVDTISESSANDPLMGDKDGAKNKSDAKKKEEMILKWTRVRFNGQMISYPTAGGTGRQTTFLDQVRVFHKPGDDPNVRDPNDIGKDGLYLTCQRLTIVQRKVGGKNSQELIADGATGMVNFQTEELHGTAKTVKYDDGQDQIIFEGSPATLYKKANIPGMPAQRFQGTKMLYNRKTGALEADGVRVITSWLTPAEAPPIAIAHLETGRDR